MAQQESAHCEPAGGTLSLLVLGLDHSTAAQSVPLRWYSGTFPMNEGLQWRTSQGMFTAQNASNGNERARRLYLAGSVWDVRQSHDFLVACASGRSEMNEQCPGSVLVLPA